MGKSKQRIKELERRVEALEIKDVIFNTIFSRKADADTPICNIISRPGQLTKQEKENNNSSSSNQSESSNDGSQRNVVTIDTNTVLDKTIDSKKSLNQYIWSGYVKDGSSYANSCPTPIAEAIKGLPTQADIDVLKKVNKDYEEVIRNFESHYLDLIKQCGGDIGMIEAVTREWNRRIVK